MERVFNVKFIYPSHVRHTFHSQRLSSFFESSVIDYMHMWHSFHINARIHKHHIIINKHITYNMVHAKAMRNAPSYII